MVKDGGRSTRIRQKRDVAIPKLLFIDYILFFSEKLGFMLIFSLVVPSIFILGFHQSCDQT